ncbi:membrane-spanning 4-domains subfamily A member 6A isoform X1 [Oryctolagus cuniculus]|uniref:membrane-spanning 4-domains subfamily A member 6A isoform X1 n=1 Tax=Oryctolagus cuniculus TaxID=9986 RepID=UPI0038794326
MIPQPTTKESVVVLTASGINFPQTEKPKPTNQRQDSLKHYLKSEVKVTGAIQILSGVMVLSLGIILASASFSQHFTSVFSILLKSGYPFIGALCFILSGILSIITEKRSTKSLVHSSLAISILSVLSALLGFILLFINLAALGSASQQCEVNTTTIPTMYPGLPYASYEEWDCYMAKTTLTGALSLMLIHTMLELFLAVLAAVLWWKQAHSDFPGSVLFLPQSYKNKYMSSKVAGGSGYEELMSS